LSTSLLHIKNLCIERGEQRLIDGLNLEISAGEILQVSGSNGAGKTTLLRTISGLRTAEEGDFLWRDEAVYHPNVYTDELLYLGHKSAVRMQLSALENLNNFADRQPSTEPPSMSLRLQALKEMGLAGYEEDLCGRLSAGQRRRVGLARLRLSQAALWILDEPFTAIDHQGVDHLCGWMDEFAQQGGAVIYTTHQPVTFPTITPRILDLNAADLNTASAESSGV